MIHLEIGLTFQQSAHRTWDISLLISALQIIHNGAVHQSNQQDADEADMAEENVKGGDGRRLDSEALGFGEGG